MRSIFACILIIAGSSAFSQSYEMRNLSDLNDQYVLQKSRDSEYNSVEGTPYLDKEFVKGEIVVDDTMRYLDIPLRYNIYNDKIEFKDESGQVLEVGIDAPACIYKFGPHRFVSTEYIDRGKEKQGILEVLVEGHVQLFKQYIVDFKQATETKGYEDAKPNRFVRQGDEYFLAIDEGKPEFIRNSKALLEKLKPLYPDIEEYKKSQKLKLRSENDFIRLIQYCNEQ